MMQNRLFVAFEQHKNQLFYRVLLLFDDTGGLFADTKLRENAPQKIITGEGSGDFAQRALRQL